MALRGRVGELGFGEPGNRAAGVLEVLDDDGVLPLGQLDVAEYVVGG